jgi:hypothetical protein
MQHITWRNKRNKGHYWTKSRRFQEWKLEYCKENADSSSHSNSNNRSEGECYTRYNLRSFQYMLTHLCRQSAVS